MKNINAVKFNLFVIAFCLLGASCTKKPQEEIGFGLFEDGFYLNEYLELKINIPSDWSIQDSEFNKQMMETGSDLLAGDNDSLGSAIKKAAELQTLALFSLMKYPAGSPVDYNPSIIAFAERIKMMPGIKNGKDYHYHSKKLLEQSQIAFIFPKEVYRDERGGYEFYVLETEVDMGIAVIKQKYFATVLKGYVLAFVHSYTSDDEEEEIMRVFETIERL